MPTVITSTLEPFPTRIVTSSFASLHLFRSSCFELPSTDPFDATPISSVSAYELVQFGVDYVIPNDKYQEDNSAPSSEQIDEEIEVEENPSQGEVIATAP